MRLPGEQEGRGISGPVVYTIAAVCIIILLLLGYVLVSEQNTYSDHKKPLEEAASPSGETEEETAFAGEDQDLERLYKEHKLRSEDLDFWDMYEQEEAAPTPSKTPAPTPEKSPEPTEEELAADGKHVQVFYKDGTSEWIEIEKDIPRHTYDFTKMKAKNGKLAYYDGNQKRSFLGVELSEDSGQVDFEALKQDGVDFVMLKIGERGYATGLLTEDASFAANRDQAVGAGLEVGVYFSSQAVTPKEAEEEAAFVTERLTSSRIKYPVVFRMDEVLNDRARTDVLKEEQKTEIAEAFLSFVERDGYSAALYGSKDWLLTELEPELLKQYDIFLTDFAPVPDYPYDFKLWEYAGDGQPAGVSGEVKYIISFVNYAGK